MEFSEEISKSENQSKNWLTAYENPLADLYSISQCMCLCDIVGENENCLVVADLTDHKSQSKQMKLKVFKGIHLIKETNIIDLPTGVVSFFLDQNEPRTPAIAIASGPYIYIYKNVKPYFKFTLPLLETNEKEEKIWKSFTEKNITSRDLVNELESLRQEGVTLTVKSNRLLGVNAENVEEFLTIWGTKQALKRQTVATCLTTLKKCHSDVDAISCLVVGTEASQLLIIDPEAFTVLHSLNLDSVPVFICTMGLYDVEFRVYATCRNGCIYVGKRGSNIPRKLISLNTQPVGMIRIAKTLMVACMDNTLRCISPKGKEIWKKELNSDIVSMCPFESDQHGISGLVISLGNGTVQIYKEKDLLETLTVSEVVTGLLFGPFGREQYALLMITRTGCLQIKLLKRTAKLQLTKADTTNMAIAQNEKLNVPKKTKLFIDQAFRERENAVAIHRKFMQDLSELRLITARNYLDLLQTKKSPVSNQKSEHILFSAEVNGMGPLFTMNINLKNTSLDKPITNLLVIFVFDNKIYSMKQPIVEVPFLVPGSNFPFAVYVENVNEKGISDTVKVLIMRSGENEPILRGAISMPPSDNYITS